MDLRWNGISFFLLFFNLPGLGIAQERRELDECTKIITAFCGPIPTGCAYVQINVKTTGGVVEDIDRGWVLRNFDLMHTILNDRLLIRNYSKRSANAGSPSFEIVPRADEPLSKKEHRLCVEARAHTRGSLAESHKTLNNDFVRYPFFRDETSRLVYILMQSMLEPTTTDELLLRARDVDFESAYHFYTNGCHPYKQADSWGTKAKCCLANCFLTQVFAKISDTKRVPIDECIDMTEKLIELIESQTVDCSRLPQLKAVEANILAWKREKSAVDNRLKYFPTPQDVTLDFLMLRGNINTGDRATVFEDDHYDELKYLWSNKDNFEACKALSDCDIPCRYVVSDRSEGPLVLNVGQVLRICGPREIFGPRLVSPK